MHVYGHQWSCQLIYNPRLRTGLGLSDGEGVERLWSCLRKLIGITRMSGVRNHLPSLLDTNNASVRDPEEFGLLTGKPRILGMSSEMTWATGSNAACSVASMAKVPRRKRFWRSAEFQSRNSMHSGTFRETLSCLYAHVSGIFDISANFN